MILSGRDISWYMERGQLIISPCEAVQFRQNGIDLLLSDVEQHPVAFTPGVFYLGCTAEHLELPNDLMAFVQLRSSWARKGVMLPPTIVDAGFKGNLTLEIVCFNPLPLAVPYKERFAHLIFAKMSSPSEPYDGRYQGQSGITPPRY